MGEGEARLKERVAKLKADTAQKGLAEKENMDLVVNQLAALKNNSQLATMYAENAQVGAKNLAGELPLLKVHATGRSIKNVLSSGQEPNDGWFFYKVTAEQFEIVRCHILTISRGFRAEGMEGKEDVFNQILGGLILDGDDIKPFIMYFTGLKLSYLWEFGKEANKYTHAKPVPIPMFALTIELKTEKVTNSYGKSWVVKFEIVKDKEDIPILVMDPAKFQFLKEKVEKVEDTIASLIATKANKEGEEVIEPVHEVPPPDDMPF